MAPMFKAKFIGTKLSDDKWNEQYIEQEETKEAWNVLVTIVKENLDRNASYFEIVTTRRV